MGLAQNSMTHCTRMTDHCTEWAYNCCRDSSAVLVEGHIMLDLQNPSPCCHLRPKHHDVSSRSSR